MTLQDVKEQLGHSTIVLTSDTYGHLLDGRRSEMARELEAVLGGRARGRVEVLNAGIHGSGTSDQVIWFDRWVSFKGQGRNDNERAGGEHRDRPSERKKAGGHIRSKG